MERDFAVLMPSILLLLAGFIYHLYERHALFIVLLPALMTAWGYHYMQMDFRYIREFTGLKDAFAFAVNEMGAKTLLIDTAKTGYTDAAFQRMMAYYIPSGSGLQIKKLDKHTARQAAQSPKTPVLIPLCTQVHLIEASLAYGVEEDREPYVFGNDICLMTVHPVAEP